MKKIINFFKRHSWILLLIGAIIFIPQSFGYQSKLNMRVLVSGLAIDKVDSGYEVTAQVIMPSAGSESGGGDARLDFISEKGESVAEGIQKIAYKIGKTAGLSHTGFVMVGDNMLEDNLATALDYFARDAKVNPSIMLLICDGKAKDMIKETKNLELSVGVGLQKVFIYKQNSLNGVVMPVEEFINTSFGISKSSIVSGVLIAPEGDEKLSTNLNSGSIPEESALSSKQASSSSGSSNEGQEKNARIKYHNDIFYFKEGRYVNKLDNEQEILGVYLSEDYAESGEFKIRGVTGGVLEDATIGVSFTSKKNSKKIKFENGTPKLIFNISIKDIQIVEILNKDKPTINIYNREDKQMIELVRKALAEEIEECITAAFEKAKFDNVDIFDLGERAYQLKYRDWEKYYDEYGENYLKNAEIEVNVKIRNVN